MALTPEALIASAPERGKPTYVFEFKPRLGVATGGGSGTVSGGAISCPGICESNEWLGDTVTLSATPATGSVFTGWSGACGGTGVCEVTMGGSREVTANFDELPPPEATLTVTTTGQGSISGGGIDCPGTCEVSKPVGSTLTLTATPASGWEFTGWSGGLCSGTGDCAVTLHSDQAVSATFTSKPNPGGGGTPQPPAGPPAPGPSPGPPAQAKEPLKCKKGSVKKKVKGKPRCVKRKKKKKKGGRANAGRYSFILKSSIYRAW